MQVNVSPPALNFGPVFPGAVGPDITSTGDLPSFAGGVSVDSVPVDANVTVSITDDNGAFFIRDVFVLEYELVFVGGGDPDAPGAHPHRERELQVVAAFDGTGPVPVRQGQTLWVRVRYAVPQVDQVFSASLSLTADTWDPVQVPLSVYPQLLSTSAPETLHIAQGNDGSIPVTVHSSFGPDVDVVFAMSPTQLDTGLSLPDTVLPVGRGQTASTTLSFHADRQAPLGVNQVAILRRPPPGFFITATVVSPGLTVNAAGPTNLRARRRDTVLQVPVRIGLNGGDSAEVGFTPGDLPPGVTVDATSVYAETDQTINVTVYVSDAFPQTNQPAAFSIRWTCSRLDQNGQPQSGVLDYHVTVMPDTLTWHRGDLHAATVGGWQTLAINSDGYFLYRGHVHNAGVFDLHYGVSAVLDLHDGVARPLPGREAIVSGTSLFHSGGDDDWAITGYNPFLADNFDALATAEAHYLLHADPALFDLVQGALLPYLAVIGLGKALVENILDINIGGGTSGRPCSDYYDDQGNYHLQC
jgi:hypothetical protein